MGLKVIHTPSVFSSVVGRKPFITKFSLSKFKRTQPLCTSLELEPLSIRSYRLVPIGRFYALSARAHYGHKRTEERFFNSIWFQSTLQSEHLSAWLFLDPCQLGGADQNRRDCNFMRLTASHYVQSVLLIIMHYVHYHNTYSYITIAHGPTL